MVDQFRTAYLEIEMVIQFISNMQQATVHQKPLPEEITAQQGALHEADCERCTKSLNDLRYVCAAPTKT